VKRHRDLEMNKGWWQITAPLPGFLWATIGKVQFVPPPLSMRLDFRIEIRESPKAEIELSTIRRQLKLGDRK